MPMRKRPKKIKPSDIRSRRIFPRKNEKIIGATNVNGRGALITFQKLPKLTKPPKAPKARKKKGRRK